MGRVNFSDRVECAICGVARHPREVWFLLTEHCWEDKLKVWRWNLEMSREASARSVCSQEHARELVIHWMITGCLHYPFASVPMSPEKHERQTALLASCPGESALPPTQLGELSVDREGIARVLINNPWSLNAVLDELMMALDYEIVEEAESDFEDPVPLAPRMV